MNSHLPVCLENAFWGMIFFSPPLPPRYLSSSTRPLTFIINCFTCAGYATVWRPHMHIACRDASWPSSLTSNRLPRQLGVSNNMDVNAGCHQARSTWQSCKDRSLLKRCYFQFVSLNAHFYIFCSFYFSYNASSDAEGRGVKVQSTVTLSVWSRLLCGVWWCF